MKFPKLCVNVNHAFSWSQPFFAISVYSAWMAILEGSGPELGGLLPRECRAAGCPMPRALRSAEAKAAPVRQNGERRRPRRGRRLRRRRQRQRRPRLHLRRFPLEAAAAWAALGAALAFGSLDPQPRRLSRVRRCAAGGDRGAGRAWSAVQLQLPAWRADVCWCF